METTDILLSDTEELQATAEGDFLVGDCSNKYIKYIIVAAPGHYKMNPTVGANIYQFINANASPAQIERAIRLQLENDIFERPRVDCSKFPTIYVDKIQMDVA